MSDLIRDALRREPNISAVSKATGVHRASIALFIDGQQSLRLDKAEALARHFDIVAVRKGARHG